MAASVRVFFEHPSYYLLYVIYVVYLSILRFYDKGIGYILYLLYNIHSQLYFEYYMTRT